MGKYSSNFIGAQFEEQKKEAVQKLKGLKVYCGYQNSGLKRSLNGWIFEQVVEYFLIEELKALGIINASELMTEQYPLKYELEKQPAKIDLKIDDKILIEIKVWGYNYGHNTETKLTGIIKSANEQRLKFLYITRKESNPKKETSKDYRADTIKLIGKENCFFLDDENEDNWQKFVNKVHLILKEDTDSIQYKKTKK